MKNRMTDKVRIAIVGAGRVANHYREILSSGIVKNFTVVGVCDINIDSAAKLSRHWRCEHHKDLESLIKLTTPDLVIILTPSGMHYQHALKALKLGCNVLVEKPITMIPSQAEQLVKVAKECGLMLGVAFQNRLNPAILKLSEAVNNNRFGKTTGTIRLRWCREQEYYEDGWHGTWAQDGGVINQQYSSVDD